jgi:Flp pilus assembly protein TadG
MMTVHNRAVRAAARFSLRFRDDTCGNVAIIFALVSVVLMLAIGAAVDVGRWLHARDQTVAAIDAAVLAGGRALQTNSSDKSGAIAAAKKYYDENVTSRLPVINDSVNFAVAPDGMGMRASGTAFIKTPFLQFAAIDKLPLLSTSQTDFGKSQIAVGGNGGENIEVSVMLDVTLSMQGTKINDLKTAAKDLVNIIIWADQSKFTSKVALVPFSEDIRLPSTALNKARGTGLATCKELNNGTSKTCGSKQANGTTRYYLSPCAVERKGTQKYTDVAPGSGNYVMANYTDDGNCTIPSSGEVVPLTSDKTSLISKIDKLSVAGGTAGHLGTAWAWYMLAPNWASLWSSASQPKAYGTADLRKIAILMTDGEYNTQYDTNGVKTGLSDAGAQVNGDTTTQARALCTNMKAKGIVVYTVGFGDGMTSKAKQTLQDCATDSTKYYNADDGDELKQAFRDIALKLSSLYLSK